MQQVRVLSDELGTIKGEIINMKAAHAALHQSTSETSTATSQKMYESSTKLSAVEQRLERIAREAGETRSPDSGFSSSKANNLIEPKNVLVDVFAGSMTDNRSKFLARGNVCAIALPFAVPSWGMP